MIAMLITIQATAMVVHWTYPHPRATTWRYNSTIIHWCIQVDQLSSYCQKIFLFIHYSATEGVFRWHSTLMPNAFANSIQALSNRHHTRDLATDANNKDDFQIFIAAISGSLWRCARSPSPPFPALYQQRLRCLEALWSILFILLVQDGSYRRVELT